MVVGYGNRYIQNLLNYTLKFSKCYYIKFYLSTDHRKIDSLYLKYLSYKSAYYIPIFKCTII